MLPSQDSYCTSHKLANGIYEIHIHQATRKAVEAFFQQMQLGYEEAISKAALPVRMLVNTPPQALPVIPLTAELKKWTARYGQIDAHYAILYEGLFGTMVDVLVRNFGSRTTQMRIFKPTQHTQALAWLLEG